MFRLFFILHALVFSGLAKASFYKPVWITVPKLEDHEDTRVQLELNPENPYFGTLRIFDKHHKGEPRMLPVSGPSLLKAWSSVHNSKYRYQRREQLIGESSEEPFLELFQVPQPDGTYFLSDLAIGFKTRRIVGGVIKPAETLEDIFDEDPLVSAEDVLGLPPLEGIFQLNVDDLNKPFAWTRVLQWDGRKCTAAFESDLIRWMAGYDSKLRTFEVSPNFLLYEGHDRNLSRLVKKAKSRRKHAPDDPFVETGTKPWEYSQSRKARKLKRLVGDQHPSYRQLVRDEAAEEATEYLRDLVKFRELALEALPEANVRYHAIYTRDLMTPSTWIDNLLALVRPRVFSPVEGLYSNCLEGVLMVDNAGNN